MRLLCSHCALPFERSAGEITGGIGINSVLTLFIVVVLAFIGGSDPSVPLVPLLAGLTLFAVLFPIAFYPSSRGLWAGVLYLTGANDEGDDIGTIVQPVGTMTHQATQELIRQAKHGRRLVIVWCEGDVDVTAYLYCRPNGTWVQQTSCTPRGSVASNTSWERHELSEVDVARRLRAPDMQITVR